jgi:hypothetical protein
MKREEINPVETPMLLGLFRCVPRRIRMSHSAELAMQLIRYYLLNSRKKRNERVNDTMVFDRGGKGKRGEKSEGNFGITYTPR